MDADTFLARVARYHADGWRLSVINATAVLAASQDQDEPDGTYDISWSFARGREFEHLRERVHAGEPVPSISGSYPASWLYENELRELFGIEVTGLALDLNGQLYRTATRVPFSARAIRERVAAHQEREQGQERGQEQP